MSVITTQQEVVFACYSAACRPPRSGGTGGSGGGKGKGGASGGGGGGEGTPRIKGGFVIAADGTKLGKVRANGVAMPTVKVHGQTVYGNKREIAKLANQAHEEVMAKNRTAVKSGERRTQSKSANLTAVQHESLAKAAAKLGPRAARAADVKMSRDGSTTVAGVKTGLSITKASGPKAGSNGYKVTDSKTGSVSLFQGSTQARVYKTQSLARNAVAKEVNLIRPLPKP